MIGYVFTLDNYVVNITMAPMTALRKLPRLAPPHDKPL